MLVLDKYIFKASKALNHRTCDNIINVFEKSNYNLDEVRNYYVLRPSIKDVQYNYLRPILNKFLLQYCDKHIFLERRRDQWSIDSDFNIQKYLPGTCLLYTSPSPRDGLLSRMPSSA